MLDIIKAYAVKNLCYIKSQKMVPCGIVVHSTGVNNPYLKRYVDSPNEVGVNSYGNHWNQPKPDGREVCVHAFIGYDKNKKVRIAELLPHNVCCWGVGQGKKGSYNYSPAYIQFEICEDKLTDKAYYKAAFDVAAEYCAELCKAYGINVNKIVGHYEAYRLGYGSNHSDPEHWMKNFGENMDDLRNRVSDILKNNNEKTDNKQETKMNGTVALLKISKGDLVSISSGALYYNGKLVPSWVQKQKWYVKEEPINDRVVIDKSENGVHSICSPISAKYLVIEKANNSGVNNSVKNKSSYLIKVTADTLDIHKGAGSDTVKVGSITDKGVYTIVEEKNGIGASLWGKIKSGAGWISLDHTKKL